MLPFQGKSFVIELGKTLGLLPFSDKSDLTKEIQSLGGTVVSIVTETNTTAVITRTSITASEFDSSLPLQAAIHFCIPVVSVAFLKACSGHQKLVKMSQFATVKFPTDSIELRSIIKSQLVSSSTISGKEWLTKVQTFCINKNQHENLFKTCQEEISSAKPESKEGILFRNYNEDGESQQQQQQQQPQEQSPPQFPKYPNYRVVRSAMFSRVTLAHFKIELHVSLLGSVEEQKRRLDSESRKVISSSSTSASENHQLFIFPFRIVQYAVMNSSDAVNNNSNAHGACFALTSDQAEYLYERQVALASMKYGEGFQRLFSSAPGIGSRASQNDLALLMMAPSDQSQQEINPSSNIAKLLGPKTTSLVKNLFLDTYTLLRERASQELCDSALSSSLSLADVYKAEASLSRICMVIVSVLQNSSDLADPTGKNNKLQYSDQEQKIIREASREFFSVVKQTKNDDGNNNDDPESTNVIDTIESLQEYENVIMALKSLLNVGESCLVNTNIIQAPPAVQYASLDCIINHITEKDDVALYEKIRQNILLQNSNNNDNKFSVSNIFQLSRAGESRRFASSNNNMANTSSSSLLFHGTHAGCITSILQTGLQVPNVPRLRRDAGFLGRGVYFGHLETALKYATPSRVLSSTPFSSKKSFFVLACEVSLGRVWETGNHQIGITSPPVGYDSVRGIKSTDGSTSFVDDEFVVYRNDQIRLAYLIEFTQNSTSTHDSKMLPPPPSVVPPPFSVVGPTTTIESVNAKKVDAEFKCPKLKQVVPGLQQSSNSALVPLEKTVVKGRVLDLIGEFTILQQYYNQESSAIEGKYVFPLQSGAAVCAFEAYINDKKVVGVVKEKEEARKEYKAAVARGDGAYLMDESEETPDVFTISVGNLPPKCRVVIKIVYIIELTVDSLTNSIEVRIPSDVHPVAADIELKTKTQNSTVTRVSNNNNADSNVSIEVSFDMPFEITALECSHDEVDKKNHKSQIRRKRTQCRATISAQNVNFSQLGDFILRIQMTIMKRPRIWIEQDGEDFNSKAAMITFFPETDDSLSFVSGAVEKAKQREVLILLDGSASIRSTPNAFTDAKTGALLLLNQLSTNPEKYGKWKFNVGIFGTFELFCFPRSVSVSTKNEDNNNNNNNENISRAIEWIQNVYQPVFGGTRLLNCLENLGHLYSCDSPSLVDAQRQVDVIVFSDGFFPDETSLFTYFKNNHHNDEDRGNSGSNNNNNNNGLRIFPVAVGDTASKTSLYALARHGRGRSAILSKDSKNQWPMILAKHLSRCSQISLSDVTVEWSTEPNKNLRQRANDNVVQSPKLIPSVFSGEHTIVYGNILPQAQVRQCELIAKYTGAGVDRDQYGDFPEQRQLVTASSFSMIQGKLIHRLAAKSRIRDWLEGSLMPSILDPESGKTNTPALYSSCSNEALKAATKQEIINIGCKFGLVTPFTSMIAVEERSEEEKVRLARGETGSCTTPVIETLSEKIIADMIPEVSYLDEDEVLIIKSNNGKNNNRSAWNRLSLVTNSAESATSPPVNVTSDSTSPKTSKCNNKINEDGILVSDVQKFLKMIENNEEYSTCVGNLESVLSPSQLTTLREKITEFFTQEGAITQIQNTNKIISEFFTNNTLSSSSVSSSSVDLDVMSLPQTDTLFNQLHKKFASKSYRGRLVSLFEEEISNNYHFNQKFNLRQLLSSAKWNSSDSGKVEILQELVVSLNVNPRKYLLPLERLLASRNVALMVEANSNDNNIVAESMKVTKPLSEQPEYQQNLKNTKIGIPDAPNNNSNIKNKPNFVANSIRVTLSFNQLKYQKLLLQLLVENKKYFFAPLYVSLQENNFYMIDVWLSNFSSREADLIEKMKKAIQEVTENSSGTICQFDPEQIMNGVPSSSLTNFDNWKDSCPRSVTNEECVNRPTSGLLFGSGDDDDDDERGESDRRGAAVSSLDKANVRDRIQRLYAEKASNASVKKLAQLENYSGAEEADLIGRLTALYGGEESPKLTLGAMERKPPPCDSSIEPVAHHSSRISAVHREMLPSNNECSQEGEQLERMMMATEREKVGKKQAIVEEQSRRRECAEESSRSRRYEEESEMKAAMEVEHRLQLARDKKRKKCESADRPMPPPEPAPSSSSGRSLPPDMPTAMMPSAPKQQKLEFDGLFGANPFSAATSSPKPTSSEHMLPPAPRKTACIASLPDIPSSSSRSSSTTLLSDSLQSPIISATTNILQPKQPQPDPKEATARETAKRISELQNRTLQSLQRCEATIQETQQIGEDAATVLRRQTEQMQRINQKLDLDSKPMLKSRSLMSSMSNKSSKKDSAPPRSSSIREEQPDTGIDLDRDLDQITAGLASLRQKSTNISSELSIQNALLAPLDDEMEQTEDSNARMRQRRASHKNLVQDQKEKMSMERGRMGGALHDMAGDFKEVNDIFCDFASLHQQQSASIDVIDSNIACTGETVMRGLSELKAASSLQSAGGRFSVTSGDLASRIQARLRPATAGPTNNNNNNNNNSAFRGGESTMSSLSKQLEQRRRAIAGAGEDSDSDDDLPPPEPRKPGLPPLQSRNTSSIGSSDSSQKHLQQQQQQQQQIGTKFSDLFVAFRNNNYDSRIQLVWKAEGALTRFITLAVPSEGEPQFESDSIEAIRFLPALYFYKASSVDDLNDIGENNLEPIAILRNIPLPCRHRAGSPAIIIKIEILQDASCSIHALPIDALVVPAKSANGELGFISASSFVAPPTSIHLKKHLISTTSRFYLYSDYEENNSYSTSKSILGIEITNLPSNTSESWLKSFFVNHDNDRNNDGFEIQIERCPATGMCLGKAFIGLRPTAAILSNLSSLSSENNNSAPHYSLLFQSIHPEVTKMLKKAIQNKFPGAAANLHPVACLAWQSLFVEHFEPIMSEIVKAVDAGQCSREDFFSEGDSDDNREHQAKVENSLRKIFGMSSDCAYFSKGLFEEVELFSMQNGHENDNNNNTGKKSVNPLCFVMATSVFISSSLLKMFPRYISYSDSITSKAISAVNCNNNNNNSEEFKLLSYLLLCGSFEGAKQWMSSTCQIANQKQNTKRNAETNQDEQILLPYIKMRIFDLANRLSSVALSLSGFSDGGEGNFYPFEIRIPLDGGNRFEMAERSCEANVLFSTESNGNDNFDYCEFTNATAKKNNSIF